VPGSTLTNPNDTVGTSVGGHSQFGINVTTDQLSATGFTPFNPFDRLTNEPGPGRLRHELDQLTVVLFRRMDTSSYRVEQEVKLVTKDGIYPVGTMGKITAIENGIITVAVDLTQFGGRQKLGLSTAAYRIRPISPTPTSSAAERLATTSKSEWLHKRRATRPRVRN
jgi:hypothetical protein